MAFKPKPKRRWGADSRYYLRLSASKRFADEAAQMSLQALSPKLPCLEIRPMPDTPDNLTDAQSADELLLQNLYRAKADDMYATHSNDCIEIDEQAVVSLGEDGAWVAAWVWVAERDLSGGQS